MNIQVHPTSSNLTSAMLNSKKGRARLWHTALKFFIPVLRITSPDHLDVIVDIRSRDYKGAQNCDDAINLSFSRPYEGAIFQSFKLLMLEKCVLTILELNWDQRWGHKKTKLNICHRMLTSSTQLQNRSFQVVERTRIGSLSNHDDDSNKNLTNLHI